MTIFNSYVKLPEGITNQDCCLWLNIWDLKTDGRVTFMYHIYIFYIQRKCSSISSKLRTTVQGQSLHHVNNKVSKSSSRVGAAEESNSMERVNSRLETLWGAKSCVFLGNAASVVAEVGPLFPGVRASMWQGCQPRVHRTVVRAWFALKNIKELRRSELEDEFDKMCTRL